MSEYTVMSRDLKGVALRGDYNYVLSWYESHKKYVLMEGSISYGEVMVKMKRVKVGFSIKLRINTEWWKYHKLPKIEWRFNKLFSWLIFFVHFESEYTDRFDRIVKDHLRETGGSND